MADLEVRAAVAGDQGVLARLHQDVQALHVEHCPRVFHPVSLEQGEQWFREVLEGTSARIWLACVDGEPAGYVVVFAVSRGESAFSRKRQWFDVDQISVAPAYRRRGVATALLRTVADAARAEGVAQLELNAWSFNGVARAAFEKFGFRPLSTRFGLELWADGDAPGS